MNNSHDVIVSAHQNMGHATMYPAEGSRRGIALLSSSTSPLNAHCGLFEELALYFQSADITAFRFRLRAPHQFVPTVFDLRAVVAAMNERGVEQVVLVIEAASRRAAAFAPIAYRSVVGLVDKVIGVATILPPTKNHADQLPSSLPPELMFLLRSALACPGGPLSQRELVRADGRRELFLAPNWHDTPASRRAALMAPLFSWVRRTLDGAEARRDEITLRPEETHWPDLQSVLSEPPGLAPVETSQDRGDTYGAGEGNDTVVSPFDSVWVWLEDEWQRIRAEQRERDPLREIPSVPVAVKHGTSGHAQAFHRRFVTLRQHLDQTARDEWTASYLLASLMIAEMTTSVTHPRANSGA